MAALKNIQNKQPVSAFTNFLDADFLRNHIEHTLTFYEKNAFDKDGGMFHYFLDNGDIYNKTHRHLVSSTRFVFNYAMATREFGEHYRRWAKHALMYVREKHFNSKTGGYSWTLLNGQTEDQTNHCYGIAFVMLAYSSAIKAGLTEALPWLDETWALLEKYFWDKSAGLYRDEADINWNFSTYRGQNANMHTCEALIAAYEATGRQLFLDRAELVANNICCRQAKLGEGLIWEHYDQNWQIDWHYNKDNPKDLFRPWGFQTGHQTEWTKLLLTLSRHYSEINKNAIQTPSWHLTVAKQLFDTAWQRGWDATYGGLVYGFYPKAADGFCDDDKYFWVQAESLAAAALLAIHTKDTKYWQIYTQLWAYSWTHFVDHEHGGWYRVLTADNKKISNEKSPAGKVDYHTMGACYEVLALLKREAAEKSQ